MSKTCGTCKWFRPDKQPEHAYGLHEFSHCRRHAPTGDARGRAEFPLVFSSSEACGDREPTEAAAKGLLQCLRDGCGYAGTDEEFQHAAVHKFPKLYHTRACPKCGTTNTSNEEPEWFQKKGRERDDGTSGDV